jgi:hypothetical protein
LRSGGNTDTYAHTHAGANARAGGHAHADPQAGANAHADTGGGDTHAYASSYTNTYCYTASGLCVKGARAKPEAGWSAQNRLGSYDTSL